jgi:hypothetical protein
MASANTIARLEFEHRFPAAHTELTHDGALGARAVAKDSAVQSGLKRRMAANGFHAFPCTPLGCKSSWM